MGDNISIYLLLPLASSCEMTKMTKNLVCFTSRSPRGNNITIIFGASNQEYGQKIHSCLICAGPRMTFSFTAIASILKYLLNKRTKFLASFESKDLAITKATPATFQNSALEFCVG